MIAQQLLIQLDIMYYYKAMQRDSSANFVVPNAQGQAKYSCLSNGRGFNFCAL